jgi:hypothetical protein
LGQVEVKKMLSQQELNQTKNKKQQKNGNTFRDNFKLVAYL